MKKQMMIILLAAFTLIMIPNMAFASTKPADTQNTVAPIASTQSSAIYVTNELNISTNDSNSMIPYVDRVNESHLSFALYAALIAGSMFGLEKIRLMEE